jgi:hypothetical protein
MNWKQASKDPKNQPSGDDPSLWKEQIAEECFRQCVYCAIGERPWGGLDHYHIDHYRPESKFKDLNIDICNLFLACPVCNRFKSNDWPGESDNLENICYPDPSKVDYNILFDLDSSNFSIRGKYKSANYLIHRLYLNRPQLLYERRESALLAKESSLSDTVSQLAIACDDNKLMKKAIELTNKIRQHLQARENVRPYKLAEIRKNGS